MEIQRAYKTKLDPTNQQKSYFEGCVGAARFMFNWALADRKAVYDAGGKPNKFEQKRRFNALKQLEYPWLYEYPYAILEQKFENVDRAFQNFFRRIKAGEKPGYPHFKSRHRDTKSFTLRGSITVKPTHIKLPLIGWVHLAETNYLPIAGIKILSANVSERAGTWWISLQVKQEIREPEPAQQPALGVDMGIKNLAVISDGTTFNNPKILNKHEYKLARLQRELSRRQKDSHNRTKTKGKIARLHRKIADTRNATLYNISRHITANTKPRVVVIEDLHVKDMMKNHHLAKAVSDASMGELGRQIEYKAGWNRVEVHVADRWYPSSKTCNNCGTIKETLILDERVFRCEACGYEIDRDLNASLNLAALAK